MKQKKVLTELESLKSRISAMRRVCVYFKGIESGFCNIGVYLALVQDKFLQNRIPCNYPDITTCCMRKYPTESECRKRL
jgi:hypothetical protein